MIQKQKQKICWYFIQNKCKYGSNCRNSHQIVKCFLIRHAQSQFNLIAQESEYDMCSQQAKKQYQMDPSLIDCGVTNQGLKVIKNKFINYPTQVKIDAVFVSPLKRCLITTNHLIKQYKLKDQKVIVLPHLTQVVSKICDFSGSMQEKMKQFSQFDFNSFQKYKQNLYKWQDQLIDQTYYQKIDKNEKNGKRYLKLLEQLFPTPLQSSQNCFRRTLSVLDQIKKISLKNKYQNIIIVSHNRILKYISGKDDKGRAISFGNCQMRQTYI